jgi:hypothetical protein
MKTSNSKVVPVNFRDRFLSFLHLYTKLYAFYLHSLSWAINHIGFLQCFIALCIDVVVVSVCVDLLCPMANICRTSMRKHEN